MPRLKLWSPWSGFLSGQYLEVLDPLLLPRLKLWSPWSGFLSGQYLEVLDPLLLPSSDAEVKAVESLVRFSVRSIS